MLKLATVVLGAALSFPVLADEAGDLARKHLYEGTIGPSVVDISTDMSFRFRDVYDNLVRSADE